MVTYLIIVWIYGSRRTAKEYRVEVQRNTEKIHSTGWLTTWSEARDFAVGACKHYAQGSFQTRRLAYHEVKLTK